MKPEKIIGTCVICGRPLVEGSSVNDHHLIPKTYKGTETVTIHVICHNKIHTVFSESELLRYYHTPERINSHPEMAKFIHWLRNKPAEFKSRNKRPTQRRK